METDEEEAGAGELSADVGGDEGKRRETVEHGAGSVRAVEHGRKSGVDAA
jgi:hypothetical protein